MMKRLFSLALFLSFLFAGSVAQAAATTPSDVVSSFYATLADTMKQGKALGFEGRYTKLEPAVKTAFDLPLMAKYAVGSNWSKATPEQQKGLVDAFSAFSIATYASRFTKYDGELFEVKGEQPSSNGAVMVSTTLTPKDSAPVKLNYLCRKDDQGNFKIVDVYLDASISELATRRSDFMSVIKRESFDALISSLNDKVQKMKAPSPAK